MLPAFKNSTGSAGVEEDVTTTGDFLANAFTILNRFAATLAQGIPAYETV